jgi:hypothetical protein
MTANIKNDFYKALDSLFAECEKTLNTYCKSQVLQDYFLRIIKSFIFANLIHNFFLNLNQKNIKELNLPKRKISLIKIKYKDNFKKASKALSFFSGKSRINIADYQAFKNSVERDFPEFLKLIKEIEKAFDFDNIDQYLKEKEEIIRKIGKSGKELNDVFTTSLIEAFLKKENDFPTKKKLHKILKAVSPEVTREFANSVKKQLDKNSKEMLSASLVQRKEYEKHLYETWEIPLDLLECLIKVSLESGIKQQAKLNSTPEGISNFKNAAEFKIHARALQISNEILTLLKSGYSDGANARWRSLHELAVISIFLYENNVEVSQRYLEHEIVKKFKAAIEYRANCKKLGYPPIPIKDFNKLRRNKEELCRKYNDRFQDDYGWIPRSLLNDRHFKGLEKKIKLNKLRPFYNLSCDSVHGGSKGFFRLGLKPKQQNKVLLVGPSIFGLADPIQNTAISLNQVTACLLGLKADYENAAQMNVIYLYVKQIGSEAIRVHEAIEKEVTVAS